MEWLRDLVIIVFGLGVTAALIVLAVLAYKLYNRLLPILDSLQATCKTVENLSCCVEEEVARPLAQLAAFIQGLRQAADLVHRFKHRKGE